jgi:hypothetical protein
LKTVDHQEKEGNEAMRYRIKVDGRECYFTRASDRSAAKVARAKAWHISPGRRVSVYRGETLIVEITRLGLFDDLRMGVG